MSFARFHFNPSRPDPFRHAMVEKLNVVILYERLHHVGKAVATYLHLRRDLAGDFAPDFRLWRIDLALEPAFAAEAERDLADAAVIILAVSGQQVCPPAFHRWKRGAGHDGGPPPQAVVTLMEPHTGAAPDPESWTGLLRSTATQIHDEVFVCDQPADRGGRMMTG